MIFLANRSNLDKRTLLSRIHNRLQTQISAEDSPINQVWYHTSMGNKVGVRATITAPAFLGRSYPIDEAELQVSFDFPANSAYGFYKIQWVEGKRDFMIGWHQDGTHKNLGECHFQIDYREETVQREEAAFLDSHPLNVFDQRTDDLVDRLYELNWENSHPQVPKHAVR